MSHKGERRILNDAAKPVYREDSLSVPGVLGVETLWVRKSGLEYLADIHLEVDPEITVQEGHAIGHAVRDFLLKRHACLRDVLVHLEPYVGDKSMR